MEILFLKTALIGLSIAAPVGPIGLLCIERTMRRGAAIGLATGLGAAFADALYGAVGVLGMAMVTAALVQARTWIGTVGAMFLLYLAWRTWASPAPSAAAKAQAADSVWRAFATTFLLTLSNPMTILSFIAIFAALAPAQGAGAMQKILMVGGVLAGSAIWWLFLVGIVTLLAGVIPPYFQQWVRRASALLLAGFGFWQLAQLLH